MRKGWRCVAFDLDGTLVDSLPALRHVYFDFMTALGKRASEVEFQRLVGPSLAEIAARLRAQHGLTQSHAELLADLTDRVRTAYQDEVRPAAGAAALLQTVRRVGLLPVLVSSSARALVNPLLERLGWRSAFDVVICGDDVPLAKPHPAIYRRACAQAWQEPDACVAIEDSAAGVQSAVAAGLAAIGVAPPAEHGALIAAGAGYLCAALTDVGAVLRRERARREARVRV